MGKVVFINTSHGRLISKAGTVEDRVNINVALKTETQPNDEIVA
jgi:hypothetical protein